MAKVAFSLIFGALGAFWGMVLLTQHFVEATYGYDHGHGETEIASFLMGCLGAILGAWFGAWVRSYLWKSNPPDQPE